MSAPFANYQNEIYLTGTTGQRPPFTTDLSRLEDAEITARLITVKGIGVWTTEMFLMFSLGRPDVWPIGDGGIQRALIRLYGARTPKRMLAIGERFRPVRSHAAWYLWRSLNDA